MATLPVSIGAAGFAVTSGETHTVEVQPGSRVRAASVLKPLLAWVAAPVGATVKGESAWEHLARQAVTFSDNDAAGELWSRSGGESLLAALNERLGLDWRIDDGPGEHPLLRALVTAEELARAFGTFAADRGDGAMLVRRWMREVPAEQSFGVRGVARDVLGLADGDVAVKCGWFGGERAHAVAMVEGSHRTIGAAVTTVATAYASTVAAVRAREGDDTGLALAHDQLFGATIRAAMRRALEAAQAL